MAFSTNRPLGVPAGGLTGQAVVKLSSNDYDIAWGTGSGGGGPGSVASVFGRTGNIVAQTGDYTSDLVTLGSTNLYFTNALARAAFSNTAPISYSAGVYSITQASSSTNGYLSSTDWNTFNNKGTGTVTSVSLAVPSWLTVSGAVTTTGTLAITATSGLTANQVMATPDGATGAMSLRSLVANDIPNLDASKITSGYLAPAQGGAGVPFYGDGSDGNLTVSGAQTQSSDSYFNNLTITGAGNTLDTRNYRIFVAGTLDISGAVLGAIRMTNNGGSAGSGATGGTARTNILQQTMGADGTTGNNTAGATGTTGAGTTPAANTDGVATLGGNGGGGGAGGALGAVGAAGRAAGTLTTNRMCFVDTNIMRGAALYTGGLSGQAGSSGTGDGISAGGGGASGGRGGAVIAIFCNILKRDGTTAAGAIIANGAAGANGGNAVGGGGGGGSGGGGGGCVYIVYNSLQGSTGTNIIQANGAAGGTGGTGTAGYFGGTGGSGGGGGRIILINASTGVLTEIDGTGTAGSTASAPTGTAGTAGGAGATVQTNL